MDIMKISAFTPDAAQGAAGGNPAGVVFVDSMPDEARMLSVASGLGYSETAFLLPLDDGWRVRYFAPRQEVPFCGHATIALGAALGRRFGAGIYPLALNHARITVEAMAAGDTGWAAALQSPPTRTRLLPDGYIRAVLDANHMVVALASRRRLSQLGYHFARGAALQAEQSLATFSFIHAETDTRFHARNFFAIGGAYEDPATGAAAAALAGYLREIHWLEAGTIEIIQGEDMGRPSLIRAAFDVEPGGSVRVSGLTAPIA